MNATSTFSPSYVPTSPEEIAALIQTRTFSMPSLLTIVEKTHAVFRIKLPSNTKEKEPQGTGFLIAEGLAMTVNHVLPTEEVCKNSQADFYFGEEGKAFSINFRPDLFFHTSKAPANNNKVPLTSNELDFTIVALEPDDRLKQIQKCCFSLLNIGTVEDESFANIIQYPKWVSAQPRANSSKRVALRCNEITIKSEASMMHYKTTTQPGASGSPVIDDEGRLLGLHRCKCPQEEHPNCKKAVLIGAIIDYLLRNSRKENPTQKLYQEILNWTIENQPDNAVFKYCKDNEYFKSCYNIALQQVEEVEKSFSKIKAGQVSYEETLTLIESAKEALEEAKNETENPQIQKEILAKCEIMDWQWQNVLIFRMMCYFSPSRKEKIFFRLQQLISNPLEKQTVIRKRIESVKEKFEKSEEPSLDRYLCLVFIYEANGQKEKVIETYYKLAQFYRDDNPDKILEERALELARAAEGLKIIRQKGDLIHLSFAQCLKEMKNEALVARGNNRVSCYIAHDGEPETITWIKDNLDRDLFEAGIIPILPQTDLMPGKNVVSFSTYIREADWVIIVCTKKFKEKYDGYQKGTGAFQNRNSPDYLVGIPMEFLNDRYASRTNLDKIIYLQREINWNELALTNEMISTKEKVDCSPQENLFHNCDINYYEKILPVFGNMLGVSNPQQYVANLKNKIEEIQQNSLAPEKKEEIIKFNRKRKKIVRPPTNLDVLKLKET